MFRTLFRSLKSGGSHRSIQQPPRRRPAPCRLAVEALDDRIVPASLSVGDAVIIEGLAGTVRYAEVSVILDAPSKSPVTVNYATANGTAAAGSDYDAVSGKLTFARGETSKTILISVRGDAHHEADETFFVNLSGAQKATISDGQGLVTIVDDDPRIRVSSPSEWEGNEGTTLMTFTVSLSAAYAEAVTVNYSTADGTATTADNDYLAASGTRTFAPGETSKTLAVQVVGDARPEPEETFFVNLSGVSANAVIDRGRASGTIRDDEPRIAISSVGEWEGVSLTFTVSLSAVYAEPVTIDFSTRNGTATAGEDYIAASGTLTFAAGERFKTITVATLRDFVPDGDEWFIVNLTGTSANALDLNGEGSGVIYDVESWGGYGDLYGGW